MRPEYYLLIILLAAAVAGSFRMKGVPVEHSEEEKEARKRDEDIEGRQPWWPKHRRQRIQKGIENERSKYPVGRVRAARGLR